MLRQLGPQVPGTSTKNRCSVTSVGLSSIDVLLGGGAPCSSIILLDQHQTCQHANVIARCFVAEGLSHKHQICVASASRESVEDIMEHLPELCETKQEKTGEDETQSWTQSSGEMEIAWRYKTVPQVESSVGRNKLRFDLSKKMSKNAIDDVENIVYKGPPSYSALWKYLYPLFTSDERFTATPGGASNKTLLRLLICNFGSPLWTDAYNAHRFLLHLGAFVRNIRCVVLVLADSSLFANTQFSLLTNRVDALFRLQAVSEKELESMPSRDKYNGRFQIHKLPTVGSIATPRPDVVDLVYTLHRRYLEIKILHLPPAMDGEDDKRQGACQTVQEHF
jgi:hypothetical protein